MESLGNNKKKLTVGIVQRVITPYRMNLLDTLGHYINHVNIYSSYGDSSGGLKVYNGNKKFNGITINLFRSLRIGYKGDSRSTKIFFYPNAYLSILKNDIVILEGTTNFVNNLFLVPALRVLGKKIIWWDSGYSLQVRTMRRKIIDFLCKQLIKYTHKQLAYSTKGRNYMEKYMGAQNVTVLLNTIDTSFFKTEVQLHSRRYMPNTRLELLYVGAIETRKNISGLIEMIYGLLVESVDVHVTLIGSGGDLKLFKSEVKGLEIERNIDFVGPIYVMEDLQQYYNKSDLFILPGDGGLSIIQSLLFKLPVLCVPADGTELDYLNNKWMLCESLSEIREKIENVYFGKELIPEVDINEKNFTKEKFIGTLLDVLD